MELTKTIDAIRRGMDAGLHIGAQLYVSLRGELIADEAIGLARHGVPMRHDTLMLWLSAGKPISAVAVAQVWERGLLDLDDPVAKHIPEFAANGKEVVTIRHILTHTGGFRALLGHWEGKSWDEVIAALANSRLEPRWVPGETAGYHPITSWYLLGELVRRLDGRPFDRYVREMIFEPIGMRDSWIGMPVEQFRAYGDRIGLMHEIKDGVTPAANYALDREDLASQTRPPTNARGPIRELGMFYEMMLNRGDLPPLPRYSVGEGRGEGARGIERRSTALTSDTLAPQLHSHPHPNPLPRSTAGEGTRAPILWAQTVEAITARHRVGMYDKTFKHVIDWGLGFVLQSNQYGVDTVPYGYGPHASPRTFGHSGSRSSIGYADPEHGLAVAVLFNGAPDEARHDARMREVNAAIYEDLGLARQTAGDMSS
jgi:CubicO group peptidase (beta-lactamase class C family)